MNKKKASLLLIALLLTAFLSILLFVFRDVRSREGTAPAQAVSYYYCFPPKDLYNRTGIVGAWQFNEGTGTNASDSSGQDNHGTIYGAYLVDGRFGKALSFDGVDDYVEISDSDSLRLTTSWTISMWIFRTVDSGVYERLLAKSNSDDRDYNVYITNFGKVDTGFKNSTDITHNVVSSQRISLNEWIFVTSSWDGRNIRIYINGRLDATSDKFTGMSARNTTRNLWIGRAHDYYNFHGIIDEVHVYNRSLSADEILADYGSVGTTNTTYGHYWVTSSNNIIYRWDFSYNFPPDTVDSKLELTFPKGHRMLNITAVASGIALTTSEYSTDKNRTHNYVQIPDSTIKKHGNNYEIYTLKPSPPSDRSVVLWLSFDEGEENVAYDMSGSGNVGSIFGATWTDGKSASALWFDGQDDYVEIPYSNVSITDELTVSAWIKLVGYAIGPGKHWVIVAKEAEWVLRIEANRNNVYFWVNVDGTWMAAGGKEPLNDGQWHNVVATYDGSKIKMYVDGKLKEEVSAPGNIKSYNRSLWIGTSPPHFHFDGVIDEVKIWNRALGEWEISGISGKSISLYLIFIDSIILFVITSFIYHSRRIKKGHGRKI